MPTYHYACDACGHEFEREQRITEKPAKKCPQCGRLKARRMIAGGGFILKGGGWESDLYSGPSNRAKSDSKSAELKSGESSKSESSTSESTSSPTKKESTTTAKASKS